jgi:carbon-monoxide dehydrogenase medium subunit
MKPVAFNYTRPGTLAQALAQLADDPNAKVLAGGQTLAPLLNLRLVRPSTIIDITRIPQLSGVTNEGDGVIIGACVTHAAIEDGRFDDPANGFLTTVANHIGYRAVRNRGTIGGSLVHADPSADWLAACLALSADVVISGRSGQRRQHLRDFVTGALTTTLAPDELLSGIVIPRLSKRSRTGFAKICRKSGEFATAVGAFVEDGDRLQVVIAGATLSKPIVLDAQDFHFSSTDRTVSGVKVAAILSQRGFVEGSYTMNTHIAAIERALVMAGQ